MTVASRRSAPRDDRHRRWRSPWIVVALVGALAVLIVNTTASIGATTAPNCLPQQLDVSAALAGTPLLVSPMPGSAAAMPQTQISFLGAPRSELSSIVVRGSKTGVHAGRLEPYSQGDGASFVAAAPYAVGEHVTVTGTWTASNGAATPFSFGFVIGAPDSTRPRPQRAKPAGPPGSVLHFNSAPGLRPARVSVVVDKPAATAGGDIFLSTYPGPGQTGPMIVAPDGQLVYFKPLPTDVFATNVSVQSYAGKPVLTWWQGTLTREGVGLGEGEIYSDNYQRLAQIHAGNGLQEDLHELQLTPQGTALITAWKPLYCDLTAVGGHADAAIDDTVMQEIDIRTGLVMYEWDALDHVPLADSYTAIGGASLASPWDWFHLNSINVDSDGSLLISARDTSAVYDLDAATGQINWRLGGHGSSFSIGPGASMAFQHDARQLGPDTYSVFNNNDGGHADGLVVSIDPMTASASLVAAIAPSKPLSTVSEGSLQRLTDGDWWLGWGANPTMTEFSPSGALLYEAHTPPSSASYRTLRFAWSAQPRTSPALAITRHGASGALRLYASWNGATDVASWRILAGSAPDALAAVSRAPSAGFETALAAPAKAAYVAVEALAANGHVLAHSRTLAGATAH
jgi:hypothetical protein